MESPLSTNPLGNMSAEQIERINKYLAENPAAFLQIAAVRAFAAQTRFELYKNSQGAVAELAHNDKIAGNAISYNAVSLEQSVQIERPMQLIYSVLGIEQIFKNRGTIDVLSIGPRSEMEIFSLYASGFAPERVKALDLISYSPLVQIGDMHDIPFAENSFDLLLSGWVIPYSRDVDTMAKEVIRVSRDRAIVAFAADYATDEMRKAAEAAGDYVLGDCSSFQTTAQILALFEGHVGDIYFRQDPDYPARSTMIVAFEIRK